MFVAEIQPLTQKKRRILFEDGEDLVLYQGEIRAFRIEPGRELSEEIYREIIEKLKKRATSRAMHLLVGQMRTKKELTDKLKKDGYPQEAVETAIAYVERFHYLDDRTYVEQYLAGSGAKKGKRAVFYALEQKGIERELLEQVWEEQEERDEYALAKEAVFRKLGTARRLSEKEYRSAAGFLMRKGFGSAEIRKALEEFQDAAEMEEESF